jgi:phosphomannomutase
MQKNYSHKKHLFFDMDGTITPSRSAMKESMRALLSTLGKDIIVVSGARVSQIQTQLGGVEAYALGQNGNHALDPSGNTLWEEFLPDTERAVITAHIAALMECHGKSVLNPHDLVEDRGAQISYSLTGHNEDLAIKKVFDPDQVIRKSLLAKVPFHSETVDVKIGGTTCFDYFEKGKHKGSNVARLLQHTGWEPDSCIYFGDALYEGGNDASVIGVIDTIPVEDDSHTHALLTEMFNA